MALPTIGPRKMVGSSGENLWPLDAAERRRKLSNEITFMPSTSMGSKWPFDCTGRVREPVIAGTDGP